jgi:hypothetical protein
LTIDDDELNRDTTAGVGLLTRVHRIVGIAASSVETSSTGCRHDGFGACSGCGPLGVTPGSRSVHSPICSRHASQLGS